jgi:hypothetical protein
LLGVITGLTSAYAGEEVSGVAPNPARNRLARRLRELREDNWPDYQVTQAALANALGDLAPASVSSWESSAAPKLPPPDRLRGYAQFFATHRSVEDGEPHLLPLDELTKDENAVYEALTEELIALRNEVRNPARKTEATSQKSWRFADAGPLTIVCAQLPKDIAGSFADPNDPNYTELQSFADLDSLIELHGHVRAENPAMDVYYKASPKVEPDDLSGHLVLLGGIAWNAVTLRLSEMTPLPVKQVSDPAVVETGEIFVIDGEDDQKFLPTWRDKDGRKVLAEDVGLLARVPNPINSNRTLTICNGVHSRGVLGAVRSLTDARLRDSNEQYISHNFGNSRSFAILLRIPVIEARAMTPDFNARGCVLYKWSPRDNGT